MTLEAATRPALRCSVVVADVKSLPGKVVIRTCHGKPTHFLEIHGDTLFAACQRHRNRLVRARLTRGFTEP